MKEPSMQVAKGKAVLQEARERAGLSQRDLAHILQTTTGDDWDQSKVSRYERDPDDAPFKQIQAMMRQLGVSDLDAQPTYSRRARSWDVGDPYADLRRSVYSLIRQVSDAEPLLEELPSGVPNATELINLFEVLGRKPVVSMFGEFDAGKSTIANWMLSVSEGLPANYQPTTRLATYVRHIEDRPWWLHEQVVILDQGFDPESWNVERHLREHRIEGGDLSVLAEYGSHFGKRKTPDDAFALVFMDSEILRACDILDLPGTDNDTEDTKLAEAERIAFDVAVFADTFIGFLSEGALLRLGDVIRRLPVVDPDQPLANLFIVGTHAHVGITDDQLSEGLRAGSRRAWRQLRDGVLPRRGELCGTQITEEMFESRVFAFWRELPPREEPLREEIANVLRGALPALWTSKADEAVNDIRDSSQGSLRGRIDEYVRARDARKDAEQQLRLLDAQEPARRSSMRASRKRIDDAIERYRRKSRERVIEYLSYETQPDTIEELIRREFDSKKDAQQNAVPFILERLQSKAEDITGEYAKELSALIEEFIGDYEQASLADHPAGERVSMPFNAKGAFAGGLVGLAGVGGLAFWAAGLGNLGAYIIVAKAASVAAAAGISLGGAAAWTTAVAAIGGPVTIAVGIVVVAAILGWALLKGSWQGRLAKKISTQLSKSDIAASYRQNIDEFWADTRAAFRAAADNVEEAWQHRLKQLRKIVQEDDTDVLNARIEHLEELLEFFDNVRLSEDKGR